MLKIADILGKSSAILHTDGLKIYQDLLLLYKANGPLVVSFEGVDHWATAFLNASIGKFVMNLPDAQHIVRGKLQFQGVAKDSPLERRINEIISLALDKQKQSQHDEAIREAILA